MSIPTPTADASGAAPIDTALLTDLANQLFAALPGQPPAAAPSLPTPAAGGLSLPSNPSPPGTPSGPLPQATGTQFAGLAPTLPGINLLPTGPDQAAARLRPSPAQLPHAAGAQGLPDVLVSSAPGYDGRIGSHVLDVPPLGIEPRAPVSTGAFYFIDERRRLDPFAHPAGSPPGAFDAARPPFDVQAVRRDFPILSERVNGRPLVWFDNAATTHKPRAVIERLGHFYEHENSNIHRAAHALAARATDAYEGARDKVARFIGAASSEEIIFVRGCTEAINLVAKTWGAQHIGEGDEIILSHLEHHANIVPWQQLCQATGAKIRVIPVDDSGQVILSDYQRLLGPRTKLVAVTQVSNALGTVVPVQEIVAIARRHGATTLVDGAQSISHMRVDVQALDADFFVFSGHKVFGPTGIGVVYGKRAMLEDLPAWQGGGNMIVDVTFEKTVYQGVPARFEAGTGNIADAVGLGAALDYVDRIGIENIARYEHELLAYATQAIRPTPCLRLIGTASDKASVLSFVLEGYRPEEVGRALDDEGIAVRSGHHCAQPILRRFGLEATVRPSLAFYNTCEEVDQLVRVVRRLARG